MCMDSTMCVPVLKCVSTVCDAAHGVPSQTLMHASPHSLDAVQPAKV